jgi:hypothetical protein
VAPENSASIAAKHPRSRLCNSLQTRPATEHPFIFEALRELSFETCLTIAGSTLRIGLAATTWQLEQARILLEHFQPAGRKTAPAAPLSSNERVVAIALDVSPKNHAPRAQGVITLRRDDETGLSLDLQHRSTLDAMRANGACLVEVEKLAFDRKLPVNELIGPMIQALSKTINAWGATDILTECTRTDAAFYCSHLGFKRLDKNSDGERGKILLHLSAARIARLQTRLLTSRLAL